METSIVLKPGGRTNFGNTEKWKKARGRPSLPGVRVCCCLVSVKSGKVPDAGGGNDGATKSQKDAETTMRERKIKGERWFCFLTKKGQREGTISLLKRAKGTRKEVHNIKNETEYEKKIWGKAAIRKKPKDGRVCGPTKRKMHVQVKGKRDRRLGGGVGPPIILISDIQYARIVVKT